ncbi:MAG TPA: uroporphyrinogen-III C-methyltransferase [Sedimentisphaerales bacterium]|nr:uroporphyrinogen-III C-methyltransferase [Sedimentisphaerales bacterium]
MSQGKVYLVGAGPGDAELITLKGYKLISRADVILHDHLIPSELLRLAKSGAEIISVGKFASRHTMPQPEINALLIEKANNNGVVVRLKGGDPFLFGRGGEEAEACADAGVDFEVVPGVTSALAAPAYAGIPPTHRDYTPNVAIVTGHRKGDEQLEIPKAGTIIFLMGVANIRKIVASLLDAGWPSEAKIAAIENGTCYNQRVVTGILENFVETIDKANLQTPAVFIVGRVVELQEKLKWFERKPTILVLGMHPEKYKHLGNIVHRPFIDCVPLEDYGCADSALGRLNIFDWIAFTSANGIKFFFERLQAMGLDARALSSARVAVIGKTSAEWLAEFGIAADMCPDTESSTGMLKEFGSIGVKDKKMLLPQSEIVSNELPDGLLRMGAVVERLPIYRTVEVDPGEIDFDHIDRILFTSGSTIRAFVKRFGAVPTHIKAYCLGLPSLAEAKKHNINAEVLEQSDDPSEGSKE